MASNPWDYYERLGDRRGDKPADVISSAVADVRAQRAKQTIMQAAESPVDAARVTRVAREAGEPPAIVADRVGDYEKALSAHRLSDVAARYSIVADWFEKNPRSLVAAQGDVKSVGFLGRTLEFLGNIPDALQAGTTRTAKSLSELYQSIDEAILPFTNPSGGRAQLDRYESDRASYQRRYEVQRPRSDSFVVQSALSGIESIPGSAASIAVGAVTRSPGAAATVMGVTTGAPAYREALDAGKPTGTALRYGVEQGLIEGLTEKVPAGKWLEAITKRTPAGKAILSSLAAEIPGEQLATILQDFSTWATLTPDRPFSEYLAERPQAALQTAIATITGTAAQVGATQVAVKTGDALVSRAQSARRARAEREVLTGFEKAAADSAMKANDPDGYAEMVGKMAEQSGVSGVMVDAAAVREYMQSDSYDPYSDPLEAYRDQVDEAYEVGGDVVLPSDFALGTLPGTSAWTALRDDMRLTAGGITPREAQSFEEAMADVVAEVEASQQEEFDSLQAQIDAQGKLLKSVQEKLMNAGFTPYAAQQNATLIVQRIATRAARMGQQVQGNEFTTEVRQVLPPELAAARDADATDLVINALRKGRDPASQSGPSLLEWISARGGVNDTGGDLASMGLDQWHKGKPGKRKLLRKFDPTAALGGVSGAGDYGIDNTLRAAIEAGYFPELVGVENEAGASQLDTQALLDAMSAELAGVKRYAADARVDAYRAAAEELDQLLQQRGLDPAGMSDAELRAAIAQLDREGSAEGAFEQLPDTIDIDGVQRPTRNSEGQPIAGTEEGVRAFWAWFGDSKVVDAEGRPLVVYHGTAKAFPKVNLKKGAQGLFWFTSDRSRIEAGEVGAAGSGVIMPLYAKVERPADWTEYDRKMLFELKRDYDGALLMEKDGNFDGFILNEPTQIKSINNRGTFDPADPRILFQSPREYYQSAYHGSPHIFDRFSLDKIGTGEGAQAYGWGLYFAGRKEIAEHYRKVLSEETYRTADGQSWTPDSLQHLNIRVMARRNGTDLQATIDQAKAKLADTEMRAADIAMLEGLISRGGIEVASGRLYKVEIPNDDEYLLWDKPLSEQPEKVRAAIEPFVAAREAMYAQYGQGFSLEDEMSSLTGNDLYQEMSAEVGGDRAASLALHNAGIAGIKYLDGGSRADGDGSFNYVVFDDNRISITAYEQTYGDGPRGRIRFEAVPVIELFQSRNLSTLLHELGHQYLEELRFDATGLTAPDQLIKDWETVQAWFKANGYEVKDGFIPTEAHELWARGFERYLMEGKAPSSALARVFETFRGWLMSIYKKVEALRSPITPEIREVFDRLLATDEELQQQREAHALMPLFKDAAAIGMTGPEFQAYQDQFNEARVDAQSEVLAKAMREVKARVTKEYRDQRAVVEADVTQSVDQRPLFKALRNLKTMPVRRGWLEDNMGLDVFDLMPKRVPPLWSDKGSHPDAVAEMSGYQNGRQMIEALIGAEMAHRQAVEGGDQRTLRERTIQSEVDAIMRERYGDPLTDGAIEREALAAVNGEKQGEMLASELRILSRRTGQRPTPYRIARQWARNKVRQGVYATEASPSAIQRHARAVAKHGSEAEKAMLAGKFDEAFAAKQKQMLSSALLAEAKAANDEVTTAQRYLDKIARAKTMKSVDQDYLDQAQALLEDVDLRQRSQKSLDRKESFERWAAAKQAAGEEVYVPDRFDYAGTNWSRLPVEQLLGLTDTVKSIMHLGRHKQTMLDNKDRREFDEWKADALAVLELTPGRAITNEVTEQRSNTRAAMALGLKVETLALELDNGVPGVWTALLSTRPTTAENERAANREKVLAPIAEAFRKMDRKDRDRLADRVTLSEVPFRSADLGDPRNGTPLSVSRMELIGMALNMGNESNFDKLARGYGVEQSVLEAVVNRELTEKDWQFVQSVWDALETLWPDIAATEREMSGVEPERVEVREVVTPFGTLRGGYYPLVYDPSQSQVGEDNLAKASDDMFGLSSGVATAKGHTKARTGFAAPLLLSPEQVIFGHVEKVITRNAYAPLVRDILKVMRDPTIRAAFDRKMGREYREMIEPWLRRQVRAGVTDERGVHWANKLLRQARINVTLVSMGLRFSTGVAQIAGISNSIGRIGVNQFRKGFARVLSNPRAAAEFVFERSPEMERRSMELNRDVAEAFNDLRNTSQGRKGIMAGARTSAAKARAFAFWHIGMIDRYVVSMPTWLGAYEQAISDGKSDEEASALADSAVRQSQGSGREKDMAAIQSPDSEALKFFTMFYTPFNVLLNAQWETARGARRGDWRKVAHMTFWFMIAAPLVDALLSGDAPDDDDDETWAAWLARNVLTYQVAGIPIIRDIGNYAERKIRGEYVTFGSNPVTRIFDTTARTGKDAWNATLGEGEVSDRWVRNAVETPGYFLGLPTGQVSATSQFMWDYSNGDVDPETIGEWYEGLTKGKIEEEE